MGAAFRRVTTAVTPFLRGRLIKLTLWSVAILWCLGCGQSGDPTDGQVLNATGFFSQSQVSGEAPSYTPDTSDTFSLSSTLSIPGSDSSLGFIGLENLQGTAAIVTSAASLSYAIAGSSFLVPNDIFPFSATVPASGGTTGIEIFVQVQLVSAARMSFLRANAGALPPVPFDMTVTVVVDGRSSSGDSFASNAVIYNITFTE